MHLVCLRVHRDIRMKVIHRAISAIFYCLYLDVNSICTNEKSFTSSEVAPN